MLRCDHLTATFHTGAFGLSPREVHYMLPEGEAPDAGWPVAILFQGSFVSAENTWAARPSDAFGAIHQTELLRQLLEAGYAVLTPEARFDGSTFWDTNLLAYAYTWDLSEDHQLMIALFTALEHGDFGPLDPTRLFAAGISSGGYMTSRMAVSYPGRFSALAIQSASYATCSGALCILPTGMPADHPPTLFLHGDADVVVPIDTMRGYASALERAGIEVRVVEEAGADHRWLAAAPAEIVAFFEAHPSPNP